MSQTVFYERMGMNHNNDYDRSKLRLEFGNSNIHNAHLNNPKKRRFVSPSPALLQSPDLKLLKLGSPELDGLILYHNGFIPTPTGAFPFEGNGYQEDKAHLTTGFVEALQKLQEKEQNMQEQGVMNSLIDGETHSNLISRPNSPKFPHYTKTSNEYTKVDENRNKVGVITPVIQNRMSFEDIRPPSIPPSSQLLDQTSPPQVVQVNDTQIIRAKSPNTIELNSRGEPRQNYRLLPDENSAELWNNNSYFSSESSGTEHLSSDASSPIMMDHIKTEDDSNQVVPSMTGCESSLYPTDPINLVHQEHFKHERKKLRNRLAAQRCRKRKIEREDTLKDRVRELKAKNTELTENAEKLRNKVSDLKEQVIKHIKEGCNLYLKELAPE